MALAPTAHSRLSPSGAHRWMKCAASVPMARRAPAETSSYAEEGTAAHELAARTLNTEAKLCSAFESQYSVEAMTQRFTPEMCEDVQKYVDNIGEYGEGGQVFIERRVDYSDVVGVPDSFGTADCIIIRPDLGELQLHDLKFGYRLVSANRNEQLMTYALAVLDQLEKGNFGHGAEGIDQIRLCIHQPRHNKVSEWTCSVEDLKLFGLALKEAAERVIALDDTVGTEGEIPAEFFNPGEKQCLYCAAKDNCPALTKHNMEMIVDDFVDLTIETPETLKVKIEEGTTRLANEDNATLGILLANVDLIEDWCKALRSRASGELMEGRQVPGFKLVQGKQGARKWTDEEAAEEVLKGMRLKKEEMYTFKVISPTVAEKLLKSESPRRWKTLQAHISRSEGGIHVAPDSDPRPAIDMKPAADAFTDISASVVEDLL